MGQENGWLSGIPKSSSLSSSLKGKWSESLSENVFGRMPNSSLSDSLLLGGSGMWSRGWTYGDGTGDPGVWTGDAAGDTGVWTGVTGAGLTGVTGAGWTGDPGVWTRDTGAWTGDTGAGWTRVTGAGWTGVWIRDAGVAGQPHVLWWWAGGEGVWHNWEGLFHRHCGHWTCLDWGCGGLGSTVAGGSTGVSGGSTGVSQSTGTGSTKNYMAMNKCFSYCSLHLLKVWMYFINNKWT